MMANTTQLGILIKTLYDGKGAKAATKDMGALEKQTGKTTKTGIDMKSMLTKVGMAAGAAGAALYTAKKAFDFTKEGAQLLQLEESFDLMNKQVFKTPGLLDKMTAAAKGTITDTQAMKGLLTLTAGATKEVASAMAQASPQLVKIAKAANKLNPTLGDTGFLYDSLALGIKRASPMILDNLGLTIKVGDANEKYAESIGKTVKELTAQEKQLALLEAALSAGDTLIEQVGGNVDSQADSWDRLTISIGNTMDAVKKAAAGAIVSQMDQADSHRKSMTIIDEAIALNLLTQEDFNRILEETFMGVARTDEQLENIAKQYEDVVNKVSTATQVHEQLNTKLRYVSDSFVELTDETGAWTEQAKDAIEAGEEMATVFDDLKLGTRANMFRIVGESIDEMIDEANLKELDALNKKLDEEAEAAKELADAIAERFSRIQEGIQSMLAPMGGNELSLFNEDLDQLGYRLVTVGGRTADQNRLWNQATDEVDALGQKINDMSAAPVLFSKTADEAAESIEGWTDRINELNPLIDVLGNVTSTTSSYIQEATWDYDALTTALFNTTAGLMGEQAALLAATDSGVSFAEAERAAQEATLGLGVSLGQLTQIQADAMLQQYLMYNVHLPALAKAFEAGEISADDMRDAMYELAAGEYETAAQAIAVKKEIELAKIALDNIEGIYNIMVQQTVHTAYTQSGAPSPDAPAQPPPADYLPPCGQGMHRNADGVCVPDLEYHSGGSFTVPPGYPNDGLPISVSSGEHVQITPAGKSRGGGNVLVQQFFNIRGGGNPLYIAQEAANQAANILGDKMRG